MVPRGYRHIFITDTRVAFRVLSLSIKLCYYLYYTWYEYVDTAFVERVHTWYAQELSPRSACHKLRINLLFSLTAVPIEEVFVLKFLVFLGFFFAPFFSLQIFPDFYCSKRVNAT